MQPPIRLFNISDAINELEIAADVVDEGAVKNSYRHLMKQWHPDRHIGKQSQIAAIEKSKKFNLAYEILSEYIDENGPIKLNKSIHSKRYTVRHTYRHKPFTPGFPDPNVFEHFVKSSHIVSVGYNSRSQIMFIKFNDNRVYEYVDVPHENFEEFINSESQGKYAHRNIYRYYQYRRCDEPNKPYQPFQKLI